LLEPRRNTPNGPKQELFRAWRGVGGGRGFPEKKGIKRRGGKRTSRIKRLLHWGLALGAEGGAVCL